MHKNSGLLRLASLVIAVLVLLVGPASVGAEPLGSHYKVKFTVSPVRPVAGQDTRLAIAVADVRQVSTASVPVTVSADKISASSAGGHAGMSHGGSTQPAPPALTTTAKPAETAGEFIATLKIMEEGPWRIMVTVGDTTEHLDIIVTRAQASSSEIVLKATLPAPKVEKGSAKAAPMEAVHASYLDLTANISDLRTRIGEWQKGNEDSRKIAEEKMERIEVIMASITWPKEMGISAGKVASAYGPMVKALKAKDFAAAEVASKAMGDASHDVTHEFYPDWVPALEGVSFSIMAPHAIYLDLNANINDLGARLDAWQRGDESSLNIAREKVERIEILLPHMAATGVMLKSVQAFHKALPDMEAALEKKDIAAAQKALKPISDLSQPLSRDFYSWMNVTAEATSTACIQASYLDISTNVSQLRTQVGEWQKGNPGSLKLAQDRIERIQLIADHTLWPPAMAAAANKMQAAVALTEVVFKANDTAAAEGALKDLGDGSHDVTHAYYGDWLPVAQLDKTADLIGGVQSQGAVSSGGHGGHGAEAETPNYWFVGSMVGMIGTTIVLVPVLRRRDLAVEKVEDR